MASIMNKIEWTLSEIAKLLQQPQHRLIYLCEKGVVTPEFADAHGRGSSRRFSARNIFEISVALCLSDFHFPASISANFLYAIRSFELIVERSIDDFSLPHALMKEHSPEIVGIITNGSVFSFAIGTPGKPKKVYGGINIGETILSKKSVIDSADPKNLGYSKRKDEIISNHTNLARFEINLTRIAQTLILD